MRNAFHFEGFPESLARLSPHPRPKDAVYMQGSFFQGVSSSGLNHKGNKR